MNLKRERSILLVVVHLEPPNIVLNDLDLQPFLSYGTEQYNILSIRVSKEHCGRAELEYGIL